MTSCFVYQVIRDLEWIDHLFINPIRSKSLSMEWSAVVQLLSCQPRLTVMSWFVYKVIRDLESIDHLFIYPIHRIGLINK